MEITVKIAKTLKRNDGTIKRIEKHWENGFKTIGLTREKIFKKVDIPNEIREKRFKILRTFVSRNDGKVDPLSKHYKEKHI